MDHVFPAGARWLAPSLTELLTERPAELADQGPEGGLLVRIGSHSGKTPADVQPDTEVPHVSSGPQPVDLSPRPATLEVVSGLLAAWNQPPIEVTDVRVPATLTAAVGGRAGRLSRSATRGCRR